MLACGARRVAGSDSERVAEYIGRSDADTLTAAVNMPDAPLPPKEAALFKSIVKHYETKQYKKVRVPIFIAAE